MNLVMNLSYFYFNHKFLYKRHIKLFSLTRIFALFVLSNFVHEQVVIKNFTMKNYRVNLNDLFDQDEDFLFESPHFTALIKKVKVDFEYLVNPIFDLEDIVKNATPDIEAKYAKSANGDFQGLNSADLIPLYHSTFNTPTSRNRLVYDKML